MFSHCRCQFRTKLWSRNKKKHFSLFQIKFLALNLKVKFVIYWILHLFIWWKYKMVQDRIVCAFWWLKNDSLSSYTFRWIIVYFQWNYRIAFKSKYRRKNVYFPKNYNFGTSTIHFSECRSQSQHNSIWFSILRGRNREKLRNRSKKLFSYLKFCQFWKNPEKIQNILIVKSSWNRL